MPAASPNISLEACGKLLGAAGHACAAPAQVAAPSTPNSDALANAFASLSVALTWGGVLLGMVALLAAFGFGSYVSEKVKRYARKAARLEA